MPASQSSVPPPESAQYVVKKQITLKAKPAEVWEALTNPALTKKYFYGCKVFSDWKVGSAITFKRKMLWVRIELKGKILAIEPGKLLQYTLINAGTRDPENPFNYSTVTDELRYEKGKTTLYITDDVGPAEGAEKRYKRSVKGWDKVLKGLKKVVEK